MIHFVDSLSAVHTWLLKVREQKRSNAIENSVERIDTRSTVIPAKVLSGPKALKPGNRLD